ncbi:hypothetical protein AMECASPLE_036714 [Ameca splendens]|uniref:Secreted protein n=1 Tax=Ameca splendens TaxID=208324 RepID=A0ABV0Z7C0_9TELE
MVLLMAASELCSLVFCVFLWCFLPPFCGLIQQRGTSKHQAVFSWHFFHHHSVKKASCRSWPAEWRLSMGYTAGEGREPVFCRCVIPCQNSIPEVDFYNSVCQFTIPCQNSIPIFVMGDKDLSHRKYSL